MTIFAETTELGPLIGKQAPNFTLPDHQRNMRDLRSVIGQRGVLIGFIRDIWIPASIRRILFMQKHSRKFREIGYNIALIIADQPHTLYSFHLSSEIKVSVPLLADPETEVHRLFNMQHCGLVLVDHNATVRAKWLIPDERVWLKPHDLLDELKRM